MLAILVWPFVGASVNRVHDIGQAGWMSLLFLVPIVNLVFIGFACPRRTGRLGVRCGSSSVLDHGEEFGGGVHRNLI